MARNIFTRNISRNILAAYAMTALLALATCNTPSLAYRPDGVGSDSTAQIAELKGIDKKKNADARRIRYITSEKDTTTYKFTITDTTKWKSLDEIVIDSPPLDTVQIRMGNLMQSISQTFSQNDGMKKLLFMDGVTSASSVTSDFSVDGMKFSSTGGIYLPGGVRSSIHTGQMLGVQSNYDDKTFSSKLDNIAHESKYGELGGVLNLSIRNPENGNAEFYIDAVTSSAFGSIHILDTRFFKTSITANIGFSTTQFVKWMNKDLNQVPDYASGAGSSNSYFNFSEDVVLETFLYFRTNWERKKFVPDVLADGAFGAASNFTMDNSSLTQRYVYSQLDVYDYTLTFASLNESDIIDFVSAKGDVTDKLNSQLYNRSYAFTFHTKNNGLELGYNKYSSDNERVMQFIGNPVWADDGTLISYPYSSRANDNAIDVKKYWMHLSTPINQMLIGAGGAINNFDNRDLLSADLSGTLFMDDYSLRVAFSHLNNMHLYHDPIVSDPYVQSTPAIPDISNQLLIEWDVGRPSRGRKTSKYFDDITVSLYGRDFETDYNGAKRGKSYGANLSYIKDLGFLLLKASGQLNETLIEDKFAPGTIAWSSSLMLYKSIGTFETVLNIKAQDGFHYINTHTGEDVKLHPSVYLEASVTKKATFKGMDLDFGIAAYNILGMFNKNISELARWTEADGRTISTGVPWLFNFSIKYYTPDF